MVGSVTRAALRLHVANSSRDAGRVFKDKRVWDDAVARWTAQHPAP